MLTLNVFGPAWGLPDASPFVAKALVLLEMSGLDYETRRGDPRKAPKGKLPLLRDGDRTVADSTFIRWHLEQAHGIDFDPELGAEQKATGWLIEKALEDNLYWALIHERWAVDDNFEKGPRAFFSVIPAPMRPVVTALVRRSVKKSLHAQGTGRHERADIVLIAGKTLEAFSRTLGDKPFLFGDAPSGWDASGYAFIASALCDQFTSGIRDAALSHPNLNAYASRLHDRYFSEGGA